MNIEDSRIYQDWFEIIAEQSNEEMSQLAIEHCEYHLYGDDPNGFLVVDIRKLPKELIGNIENDKVKPKTRFRDSHIKLLNNQCLTKYLAKARSFQPFGRKRTYLEILFEEKIEKEPEFKPMKIGPNFKQADMNQFLEEASLLFECWRCFTQNEQQELARDLANELMKQYRKTFYDIFGGDKHRPLSIADFEMIINMFLETTILAVILAWLKDFENAHIYRKMSGLKYVYDMRYQFLNRYYLEFLFINNQEGLLAAFFEDEIAQKCYYSHYEIYLQTYVIPVYDITRVQQVKNIKTRMEALKERYL